MRIYTCGPVAMYPEVASVRQDVSGYFRTPEYGTLVKHCLKELSAFIGNPVAQSMLYLACSGTGAMEAVVLNCATPSDKALVINGGSFGLRFCELLEYHGIPFESVKLRWNERLCEKHLSTFDNRGFSLLFVNLDETSTGQLYDLDLLSDFCERNGMLLIADVISAFLCDDFSMEKSGIDAAIFSSQKGLCCSPGCSFVSVSSRMKEKILNSKSAPATRYFDFKDYFTNLTRGQTPYTPPVMVMYEVETMLRRVALSGGFNAWINRIADKARAFRQSVTEAGYQIPDYPLSNMLTPVSLNGTDACDIARDLKEYGFLVSPCGGDLSKRIFRVCHLGNTSPEDDQMLIDALYDIRQKRIKK